MGVLALVLAVPLALLVFVTSGRLFTRSPRLGGTVMAPSQNQAETLTRFSLLRFYTRRDNGRFTHLGHWIEKWEGHRLPELINVLKGDIHMVGVKALLPADAAKIGEAWQQKRNEYQPGFTGLWYLQTRSDSSLDDTLIADAYYVATRSWRNDIKILAQTPAAWWRRAGSDERDVELSKP